MADYRDNRFELVYDWAIADNVPGEVNVRKVRYPANGTEAVAYVFIPAGYNPCAENAYAGVAVAHPNGGTKEQISGGYAQKLAEAGYVAIAADACFQGESGGEPRDTDRPAYRIEDVRRMGDFLASFPGVDPDRIGALGICGGGGYTLAAAQSDPHFRAVATLSMFNTGRVRRLGYADSQASTVRERLVQAQEARRRVADGGEDAIMPGLSPMTDEQLAALPFDLYRDGHYYYVVAYRHPRATGRYTASSLVELMGWDACDRMDLIDVPLLLMAGSEADSLYMSEEAYAKAMGTQDKELFLIDGATHIQTYYVPEYVERVTVKLREFFGRTL